LKNSDNSLSNLPTAKEQSKKVLNFETFLVPGEKWTISVSDFDQLGLDAFISVSVDATDLRVPAYQTTEECGSIGIIIDGRSAASNSKCRADNFEASSITLVNNSDKSLSVSALIIGIEKSKPNGTKY
jgi:hypothetical protein